MPFGLIFGALFFGGLCVWASLGLLTHPLQPAKIAGTSLMLLGLSLAVGLLLRRPWARWIGSFSALLMAVFVLRLVADGAGVLEHVILLGSVAAAALLVIPATGDPRRGGAPLSAAPGKLGRLFGTAAILALVGLVGSTALVGHASAARADRPCTRRSAASRARGAAQLAAHLVDELRSRPRTGAQREQAMLVTFFTGWCPYCKKMDQSTWKAQQVVERLAEVVAVRVDAEETQSRDGYAGAQLAARYGVRGFPTQLLIDPNGRIISRLDGYIAPAEMLNWLDETLGRGPGLRVAGRALRPGQLIR